MENLQSKTVSISEIIKTNLKQRQEELSKKQADLDKEIKRLDSQLEIDITAEEN